MMEYSSKSYKKIDKNKHEKYKFIITVKYLF